MAAVLSTSFAAAVTDWAAQWSLASVTGVQVGHLCAAERELAQVTQVGPGTTVTVRRGVEATSAAAHATRTPVAVYAAAEVGTRPASGSGLAAVSPRQATITLTNAQIKALASTAVTLVPAPGANQIIIPTAGLLVANFVAGAYAGDGAFDYLGVSLSDDPVTQVALDVARVINNGVTITATTGFLRKVLTSNLDAAQAHVTLLVMPDSIFSTAATPDATASKVTAYPFGHGVNKPLMVYLYMDTPALLTGGHAANTLRISVLYGVLDVTTGVWV